MNSAFNLKALVFKLHITTLKQMWPCKGKKVDKSCTGTSLYLRTSGSTADGSTTTNSVAG